MSQQESPRQIPAFDHRPALDGLRGCAALAVVGHHGFSRMTGGLLGVDLFFVLSGFLITTLLVRERERTGRVDLRAFYVRRAVRLLPAVFVAFALGAAAIALGGHTGNLAVSYGWSIVATLCYVSNWVSAVRPDQMYLLGQTWSLSIEEQFYFVWPLIVSARLRVRDGVGRLAVSAAAVAGLAAAYRAGAFLAGVSSSSLYYQTFSRLDAIMIGCAGALAYAAAPRHRVLRALAHPITATASAVLLIVAVLTVSRYTPALYLGGFTLAAVLGLSLVLFAAEADPRASLLGRVLASAPLRTAGKVSYGLYLYHAIIFNAIHVPGEPRTVRQMAMQFGITVVVTGLSYVAIEKPAMAQRARLLRWIERRRATPAVPGPM